MLMERLPLHGGRIWFCHLKCPASFSVSCPHTCPQGVEKNLCSGPSPNSQRRLGRNLSPGKCGRKHMSGGEYMGSGEASATRGNLAVGRCGSNQESSESYTTEGFSGLAGFGNNRICRRIPPKTSAAIFRDQWRNFAVRCETSRSRPAEGGRVAIGVESLRPESSRSLRDLPIGDTSL